jgi:ABC-type dipeptide/oligopeptide/nickel transport system ATPase component
MTALSIMQLLPPGGHIMGGSITLGGVDIAALDDSAMRQIRGNEIGMIFRDPMTSLNPTMTIGDQIAETVILHRGANKKTALDRAVEVLGLVRMPRPRGTGPELCAPAIGARAGGPCAPGCSVLITPNS